MFYVHLKTGGLWLLGLMQYYDPLGDSLNHCSHGYESVTCDPASHWTKVWRSQKNNISGWSPAAMCAALTRVVTNCRQRHS